MLKSVTLGFTEQPEIELMVDGITIFVGPNSSGKSLVLREIEQIFMHNPLPQGCSILRDFQIEWPSTQEEAVEKVERMASHISQPAHYPAGTWHLGNVTPAHGPRFEQITRQSIQIVVGHKSDKGWWANHFLRWGVIRLDGRSRFQLTDDQDAGDLQDSPKNALSHLFRNDRDRKSVQKLVLDAFGVHYVVDPTNLGRLRIRVSKSPPIADEQSLNQAARSFYAEATHIKQASDGIQAFAGIATALYSGEFHTILIDEPEAFLHPPLARKLGKNLADISSQRKGVLIASTHSSDFLMGCVQSNKKVRVVRLEYSSGKSRGRVVDPVELEDFLKRPLMRSANVVSALFYDGAIVTESDNDRAFYSEIYHRISKDDPAFPSILFVNAQNKQTVKDIIGPLRKFGVPAAAIVDLDIIKDGGKCWTDWLRSTCVPESSHSGLQSDRVSLLKAFEKTGREMKRVGLEALAGDEQAAARDLFDRLDGYGLFAVRRGELEQWLPALEVPGQKTEWTVSMLERLGSDPASGSYVHPTGGDVWDFMRSVVAWIRDAGRKGLP